MDLFTNPLIFCFVICKTDTKLQMASGEYITLDRVMRFQVPLSRSTSKYTVLIPAILNAALVLAIRTDLGLMLFKSINRFRLLYRCMLALELTTYSFVNESSSLSTSAAPITVFIFVGIQSLSTIPLLFLCSISTLTF